MSEYYSVTTFNVKVYDMDDNCILNIYDAEDVTFGRKNDKNYISVDFCFIRKKLMEDIFVGKINRCFKIVAESLVKKAGRLDEESIIVRIKEATFSESSWNFVNGDAREHNIVFKFGSIVNGEKNATIEVGNFEGI